MKIQEAVNIDDLRRLARRRLPRMVFDFIEGGVEDEHCLEVNRGQLRASSDSAALHGGHLAARPIHYAVRKKLYESIRHRSDWARRAVPSRGGFPPRPGRRDRQYSVHHVGGLHRLDRGGGAGGARAYRYQLYAARDNKISEDIIRRARDANLATLVLTVDVPVSSKRERNVRNGFELPLKLKWSKSLEALMYPPWIAEYLRRGIPRFDNWAPYAEPAIR